MRGIKARSPAELLRGRQLRTKLHAAAERRPVDDSTTRARVATQQEKQKKYFDLRYCARPRDYEVGEWVRFRLVPRPRKGRQAFSSPRMVMERRGRVSYKLSCGTLVHAERLTRSTDPSSGSPPARRSEVGGCPSPAGGGGGPPSPARGDGGPPPSPARVGGGGRPSPTSAGEGGPPTSDGGGPLSRGRASSPARGDGGPPPSPAGPPPSPARGEGSSSPIRGDGARGEGSSSPIRGDSVRGEGSSSPIRGNGARGEGSSSPIRGDGGGPSSLARDGGERRTRCGRRIKTPARFR
ncbi:translation initiation factor IF-2-like isoform X4 [Amphibalanus amphitrite]|uniref:translation initiation factor IF-2-like isoform X4 n=1 Tax=Amphibalanus amphitrite TaxID=1232801 RepID=UPI001C91C6F9|nr:translation initiation factor IF-2-like isoform X4 [Amphibalanus amphitrite]